MASAEDIMKMSEKDVKDAIESSGRGQYEKMVKNLPFYSRKYGLVFKSKDTFKKYDDWQKKKWVIEKHSQYKGKTYTPSKEYWKRHR